MYNDDENRIENIDKAMIAAAASILDEGRGKKGAVRQQKPEDEWETEPKGKKFNKRDYSDVRKRKYELEEQVDRSISEDLTFYTEEFGFGTQLDLTESTIEIMFEDGIQSFDLDSVFVEEVEDLTEISKDALRGYLNAARTQLDSTKKKGKPSNAVVALRAKRNEGVRLATDKLTKQLEKEHLADSKIAAKQNAERIGGFFTSAHKALTEHGYTNHGMSHKEGAVYSKYDPELGVLHTAKVVKSATNKYDPNDPSTVTLHMWHTSGLGGSYFNHKDNGKYRSISDTEHKANLAAQYHNIKQHIEKAHQDIAKDTKWRHEYV